MTVTIASWGEDCPPQPQSSSSRPGTPLSVTQEGDQIVFPGNRRTDRCWYDNRALRRTRFSKQGSRWTVECETPADDARREHGRYVVTAEATRIVIELDSEYDWTLREDHCQAEIRNGACLRAPRRPRPTGHGRRERGRGARRRRRGRGDVFVRVDAGRTPAVAQAGTAPRRCDRPGPAARPHPRGADGPAGRSGADLGAPGRRRRLRARSGRRLVRDRRRGSGLPHRRGRRFPGVRRGGAVRRQTVRIRVSAGALSGMADIRISARIEDGLGTVEPVWIDDPAGAGSGQPLGGAQVSASLQAQGSPAAAGGTPATAAAPRRGAAARPRGAARRVRRRPRAGARERRRRRKRSRTSRCGSWWAGAA